jgi:uncharacterized membrane protein
MAAIFALIYVTKPDAAISNSPDTVTFGTEHITYALVRTILDQRCVSCHSSRPTDDVFRIAPKGIMFDNNERVHALATLIKIQSVTTIAMPLGNKTGMRHEERGLFLEDGLTKVHPSSELKSEYNQNNFKGVTNESYHYPCT